MGQLVKNNTNMQTSTIEVLDKLLKYAEVFAESTIVPKHYRGNKGSILIALQTAHRMNLDPMMVMQGTYEIHGKLGMTSAFAIALANTSGLITGGIRYRIQGQGDDLRVTAYTNIKSNGEEISYDIGMKEAKAEGWTSNTKYKSLPELMLRYRAASLLIRTHLPEIINGMHMTEELEDVQSAKTMRTVESSTTKENKAASLLDSFLEVEEVVTDTTKESEIIEVAPIIQNESSLTLQGLIVQHNIPQETISKWCNAGGVATLEELDKDKVQSCIDYIIKKNHDEQYVGQDHREVAFYE